MKVKIHLVFKMWSMKPKMVVRISMFHRAFFSSVIDKIPTHALFIQHYISLAC